MEPIKIGILGGGQLGRMLIQQCKQWNLDCYFLDKESDYPAGDLGANFIKGDYDNYDDVMKIGNLVDVITVEIEHVNIQALKDLQKAGKKIHPNPESLEIIKDKGLQKSFYAKHEIPTADFKLMDNAEEIKKAVADGVISIPFIQKTRTSGYDGKGVRKVDTIKELNEMANVPSVIEELIDIDLEISVIAARNDSGEVKTYPAVDMLFHNDANLVEYVIYPSIAAQEIQAQANAIAITIINSLKICGLLAVEFLIDKKGNLFVNEIAPRPHNSGHLMMDGSHTSQFEQHLKGILNWPLGETNFISPCTMVNLLGNTNQTGTTATLDFQSIFRFPQVYLHWYGKKTTKPLRKMGHINVISSDREDSLETAKEISNSIKVNAL